MIRIECYREVMGVCFRGILQFQEFGLYFSIFVDWVYVIGKLLNFIEIYVYRFFICKRKFSISYGFLNGCFDDLMESNIWVIG